MYREFTGRKAYYMGRWWIRGDAGVWSAPAWVTRRYNGKELPALRVGMRGKVNRYGGYYGKPL